MKQLFILFASSALLAGCVAVPYDANTVYYPAPAVSATISSGYYHPYPGNYQYYHPSPYYERPAYVTPAPVIVQPPVYFNYNKNVRSGGHQPPHQRHDGARSDWQRRDGDRKDGKNGGRNEWRRDGQSSHSGDRFHSR